MIRRVWLPVLLLLLALGLAAGHNDAAVWVALRQAEVHVAQGDFPAAEGSYRVALQAAPDDPYPPFNWKLLCPSGGYHDLVKAQVIEICEAYDVDGFWFDIYQVNNGCWCDRCRASMVSRGRMGKNAYSVSGHEIPAVSDERMVPESQRRRIMARLKRDVKVWRPLRDPTIG